VFDRLARLANRRRRLVLIATVVWLLLAGVFGGPVASALSGGSSSFDDEESENVIAREQLEAESATEPEPALIVLVSPGTSVREGTGREKLREVAQELEQDPAVAEAVTYEDSRDPAWISRDGTKTYVLVFYRAVGDEEEDDATTRIRDRFEDDPAVTLGGGAVTSQQVDTQVEEDLARAEMFAFPILFLVSLFIFRGVVAALIPLGVGAFTILTTFLLLRVIDLATPLSIFALNLVIAIGLGLAIDYSLFIVSRFREELARLGDRAQAIRRTVQTAGRTVLFSGATVAAAFASLLVFPQQFLYSMGLGGIIVSFASVVAGLIVLPALLAALGPRVNAGALGGWRRAAERTARGEQTGFWYRLSQAVMRRAVPIAVLSSAFLLLLGLPFLSIRFTDVDARLLARDKSARQVHDALVSEFPPSRATPIYVVAGAPARSEEVDAFAAELRALPNVDAVSEPQEVAPSTSRIDVISANADSLSQVSREVVDDVRALDPAFAVRVGGQTAAFLDQRSSLASHLPVAIAVLALTTLLILFLMTGSVVLPIKTLVMNLLTVSATFGVLVLVFQDGNLSGVLDFESLGALDMTQPILIAFVAFALSTDYGVFLLTRIKEAWDEGASNTEAVARGLERTGRIVTAAALLFCIAVGAFSSSEIVFIKTIGVGALVAVLLDATIVRALLVPSLMKLLGDWNWWAPDPLRRLHRRIGLSESG
jgi:uncharacterized membrane protein YdfJ with MMPL/SSD domain